MGSVNEGWRGVPHVAQDASNSAPAAMATDILVRGIFAPLLICNWDGLHHNSIRPIHQCDKDI
jgi:hypothetical protein